MRDKGLWDEQDGFFYDVLALDDEQRVPLRVRSMVGLLPLTAVTTLGTATLRRLPDFAARFRWFLANKPAYRDVVGAIHVRDSAEGRLLAVVDAERLNYLIIDALHRYARFFGDDTLIEHPAGSGSKVTLTAVADDLARRLVSIFLDDTRGRRPVFGDTSLFQTHPDWHDLLPFHEYFHGDTGRGVGASHQTGWTALVAHLVMRTADRGATSNQL